MRWHANECQLATSNSQLATFNSQQHGGGFQGGNFARRGCGKVENFVEKQAGGPAIKEEARMASEKKSAAHAVSGSMDGRREQVFTGLVSAVSVQENGRVVKGGGESLVISFNSTCEAMKMQSAAEKLGLPGRMIPTPQRISAGCGMAWLAPVEAREAILRAMEERGILAGGITVMEYRSRWIHEKRS